MLQAANTDPYDPFVPKAHNTECQNLQLPLQIKASLLILLFLHPQHYHYALIMIYIQINGGTN